MSLDQLILSCKKNDRNAQSELYKLYGSKLFALCLKYSRNKTEAEDNLQDAFITIYKKISQYSHKGSFEGWLKRIAINTTLQCYRRKGVFDIINEDGVFIGRISLNIWIWEAHLWAKIKANKFYCLKVKDSGFREVVVYNMIWQ